MHKYNWWLVYEIYIQLLHNWFSDDLVHVNYSLSGLLIGITGNLLKKIAFVCSENSLWSYY